MQLVNFLADNARICVEHRLLGRVTDDATRQDVVPHVFKRPTRLRLSEALVNVVTNVLVANRGNALPISIVESALGLNDERCHSDISLGYSVCSDLTHSSSQWRLP